MLLFIDVVTAAVMRLPAISVVSVSLCVLSCLERLNSIYRIASQSSNHVLCNISVGIDVQIHLTCWCILLLASIS